MKRLMIAALAVASCSAFAGEGDKPHADVSAPMEGFYDVQITSKRLTHATKTVSKTFTLKKETRTKPEQTALAQLLEYYEKENLGNRAGFEVIDLNGLKCWDPKAKDLEEATKITFKYSYYDFKVVKTQVKEGGKPVRGVYDYTTNYVTKVVTDSLKGVYDAKTGKVYTWDSAAANKVEVEYGKTDLTEEIAWKKETRRGFGEYKPAKGYKAYEVPLKMHKQFIKTDDNKAAGGFTGEFAEANEKDENGDYIKLDFTGMTAFGTGTFDAKKGENGLVKTVSGNIAGKYPDDLKYGCYGTWKINLDTKKYDSLKKALAKKGCVELINEVVKK